MMNPEMGRLEALRETKAALGQEPLFLDTETTGLGARDEIVEICVLDSGGEVLMNQLVKPKRRIPRDATQVHGITEAHVAEAPSWSQVYPQVEELLGGRLVAAYNADFDRRMLVQTNLNHRVGLLPREVQWFCIMKAYAKFHGQWDSSRRSYRWQSLEQAGRQCGLRLPNSHRAQADTFLAKAVFDHMAGMLDRG
jgi:DNA polymerase-3 subunit epsilon